MAEEGHKVMLNVYDLSQGLARQLSGSFLGKAIEAVWHTGIVMDGVEYYFGAGIQRSPAGATPYGTPVRVVDLGVTHVPKEVFEDYLQEISPRYTSETYSLLTHNCNNFTNEVAQFLAGSNIPDYILQLPNEVMNSPMGALIMPLLQGLETTMKSGAVPQAPRFMPSTPSDVLRPAASTPKRSPNVPSSSVVAKFENPSFGVKTLKPEKQPSGSDSPSKRIKAENCVMPSAEGANLPEGKTVEAVSDDPLGAARKKVQEEIKKEFAAIMAVGELRASEAAALATRRVMERHGRVVVPTGQS